MRSRSISIRFDDETYQIAEKLAKISNISIPEMIKEMIKKKGRTSSHKISREVKKISGILKTDKDYESLREMIIDERIERYENLH
ncbi:MAG TPA: hypothetical protein VK186_27975 [Candidatus Deferrimicrobium sp.]|nr:hypothetical protein [Candidatus Kapabacteria bacterium]HLP62709.1 hypothetical protein [Candidatus Deferrimicrobium sp.]